MPNVPIENHPLPAAAEQRPVATGQTAEQMRSQLAQAVRQQVAKTGTVSTDFLDHFAASHLDPSAADSPAAWDYVALRRTAVMEQQQQHLRQQQDQLTREAAWMQQVGVMTPDPATLETYLEGQLPVYQARMEQNGMDKKQAAQAVQQLRAQTVEQHISRSLENGDWQAAQQVFHAQGACLPEFVRQRCARQVRESFAQSQAQTVWQQAWEASSQNIEIAQQQALAHVQEPDEELRQDMVAQINQLAVQQRRQTDAQQGQLFARLAGAGNVEQQRRMLASQTILDEEQFAAAQQALAQKNAPATPAQQNWFVSHCFQADTDAEKALAKGWCTGRDYFHLKALQKSRQSETDFQPQRWLCRGIETWMNKQGFEKEDITRASYAVLCGANDDAGRIALWQQIKTLLTC